MPFIPQTTSYCGPASLASVMNYYGSRTTQEEIGSCVYTEKLNGSLITDLENYAKTKNFKTILSTGRTNDLKHYLNQGRPVIVLIEMGFWIISKPHYLVLTGYTPKGFIAHTGYKASKFMPYPDFNYMWTEMGNTFLVIYKEK
ncbi:MAG: C39 family peptidase [bacterium]|nr:C39 family peptidase [bacterium]